MGDVIVPESDNFSHHDAMEIYETALRGSQIEEIVIDMRRARDASSAAFARLVLLRKALRKTGRDLCLINLHDRAAHIYHLNKLGFVLPAAQSLPN